jgi:hypothetical protein
VDSAGKKKAVAAAAWRRRLTTVLRRRRPTNYTHYGHERAKRHEVGGFNLTFARFSDDRWGNNEDACRVSPLPSLIRHHRSNS